MSMGKRELKRLREETAFDPVKGQMDYLLLRYRLLRMEEMFTKDREAMKGPKIKAGVKFKFLTEASQLLDAVLRDFREMEEWFLNEIHNRLGGEGLSGATDLSGDDLEDVLELAKTKGGLKLES